jgi:hypothetical protein
VGDGLVVADGIRNIVKSRISVIEDRRFVASGPSVAATFTATVSEGDFIDTVVLGGTASGDVTVTLPGTGAHGSDTVVFTRGGVEAANTVDRMDLFTSLAISNPGTDAFVMSATVFMNLAFAQPDHRVKIAGAADAFDLLAVSDDWGPALDATLVTELTGYPVQIGELSSRGQNNEIAFNNLAIRVYDLNQTLKTTWLGSDGATFTQSSAIETWAFDSNSGMVRIWDGAEAYNGVDVSGLGTILSVTGLPGPY